MDEARRKELSLKRKELDKLFKEMDCHEITIKELIPNAKLVTIVFFKRRT